MTDSVAPVTNDSSDTPPSEMTAVDGEGSAIGEVTATGESCGTVPGCDGHGGCGGHGGGSCGHAATGTPMLDARTIDPVIRQSAIFGVLVGLPPAGSVTIVTHEDPAPIADLLHERLPGEYQVSTETSDDDAYRVTFARA